MAPMRYHGGRAMTDSGGKVMGRRSMELLRLLAVGLLLAAVAPVGTAAAADFDLEKLNDGGYVVLLRHVKAGGADSDDFDLRNCRTQRQVGAAGRAQAEILAARFRDAGIK